MRSKSKYRIKSEQIDSLFAEANKFNASNISILGNGEFNSIYAVDADKKAYVIKIAPPNLTGTLTYENEMIKQEVFFYSLIHEKTNIQVPAIFFSDFTCMNIPSGFFIMERLSGTQINKLKLTLEEKASVTAKLAEMVAQIHSIKGEKYGYRQNGLFDNWYLALSSMVNNLIMDCRRFNRSTRNGELLLHYIQQNQLLLEKVESCLVNFDIWPPNIFCTKENGELKLTLIDLERCFWGDRISDFVCLDFMNLSLDHKQKAIELYNKKSDSPLIVTDNERIRYAIMLGYLGLIMEVEKYARYTPFHFGWWRNVAVSKLLFRKSFSQLEKLSFPV
ncbi:MAG: aminoglycoside phosphotransferase family protein [Candidatus Izemoplasmatales bacterium]|nr:aminoglycoside phosphotransferase family protein [Candidatus Izemoplasmatales bacterium]